MSAVLTQILGRSSLGPCTREHSALYLRILSEWVSFSIVIKVFYAALAKPAHSFYQSHYGQARNSKSDILPVTYHPIKIAASNLSAIFLYHRMYCLHQLVFC